MKYIKISILLFTIVSLFIPAPALAVDAEKPIHVGEQLEDNNENGNGDNGDNGEGSNGNGDNGEETESETTGNLLCENLEGDTEMTDLGQLVHSLLYVGIPAFVVIGIGMAVALSFRLMLSRDGEEHAKRRGRVIRSLIIALLLLYGGTTIVSLIFPSLDVSCVLPYLDEL